MKSLIYLMLVLVFSLKTFSQDIENDKTSQTFENQITNVTNKITAVQDLLNQNKIDEAINLLNSLPNEIIGFKFIYNTEASNLNQNHKNDLEDLNNTINKLRGDLVLLNSENDALKSRSKEEIVKFIQDFLSKKNLSDKEIESLKKDKTSLIDKNVKLVEERETHRAEGRRLRDSINLLIGENNKINNKLKIYNSSVKFGLCIGFNTFVNNQKNYIVKSDGIVKERGDSYGVSGIISAVMAISTADDGSESFLINVPLGDFTSNKNQAVGVFNERMAVGLGYAWRFSKSTPDLLYGLTLNISPYDKIDYDMIKDKKFTEPEFTILKPENYGATTAYSFSLTFGVTYTFSSGE